MISGRYVGGRRRPSDGEGAGDWGGARRTASGGYDGVCMLGPVTARREGLGSVVGSAAAGLGAFWSVLRSFFVRCGQFSRTVPSCLGSWGDPWDAGEGASRAARDLRGPWSRSGCPRAPEISENGSRVPPGGTYEGRSGEPERSVRFLFWWGSAGLWRFRIEVPVAERSPDQ